MHSIYIIMIATGSIWDITCFWRCMTFVNYLYLPLTLLENTVLHI